VLFTPIFTAFFAPIFTTFLAAMLFGAVLGRTSERLRAGE
jgi:VIT1/CCC1 family predicted Fe2+/Mn2+ transporter